MDAWCHMGVEPKWMVKRMENPYEQRDDLGVKKPPNFWKHPHGYQIIPCFGLGFWFRKVVVANLEGEIHHPSERLVARMDELDSK